MNSFYGGLTGQHFKFSAIFPSRMALAEDLKQTSYSPIGLDEFVLISYGLQNIIKDGSNATAPFNDYNENRAADQSEYNNRTFNSTLWQKIYREDLKYDTTTGIFWYKNATYTIADIEENYINGEVQEKGFCYICLGTFTGTTPLITVQTNNIAPAEIPFVEINNNEIDKPVITFNLPEAVEIFWGNSIEGQLPEGIKKGDYLVSDKDIIYLYDGEKYIEKGTFIPTFNQQNNILNTFDDNGQPNQISIDLIQNGHKDYTFATKVPRVPEITVEVTELPVVGTEMEPEMAEPSILTTKNENTLHFNFGIPEAISIKHSWSGTELTITSASGTDTVDLRGPQGLQGIQGEAGATKVKYHKQIYASIEGVNNYKEDILAIITPDIYPLALDETAMVTYIVNDNYYAGYLVINPDGQNIYAVVPLDQGSGGSNSWEELE